MTDFELKDLTRDRVPFCALMQPGNARAWNSDLGFAVGSAGSVFLVEPADLADAGLAGTPITGGRYGQFGALDAALIVEDLTVADFPVGGKSRCRLQMTAEYLMGCFADGLKIVNLEQDGEPVLRDGNFFLLWRWPLAEIESIEVDRVKKMFKWWDAQLTVQGRGGRSVFTAAIVNDYEKSRPDRSMSEMQGFADALAQLVAAQRGIAPNQIDWKVQAEGSEETRSITL
jgi:hypothetical protein